MADGDIPVTWVPFSPGVEELRQAAHNGAEREIVEFGERYGAEAETALRRLHAEVKREFTDAVLRGPTRRSCEVCGADDHESEHSTFAGVVPVVTCVNAPPGEWLIVPPS